MLVVGLFQSKFFYIDVDGTGGLLTLFCIKVACGVNVLDCYFFSSTLLLFDNLA